MKDYIKRKDSKRYTVTINLSKTEREMLDELKANFDVNLSQLVRNEITKLYHDAVIDVIYGED